MIEWIMLALVGVVAAVFGSLVGLGGGIIIVPALLMLGPGLTGGEIDHATAVGTSLAVLIVTALASSLTYSKKKLIDYRSAWVLFMTSGPAAVIGSALTGLLQGAAFQLSFGVFMLLMAALLIARDYMKPISRSWPIKRTYTDAAGKQHEYGYGLVPMLVAGFFVGLISGLFGIGGGSLFVPIMVLLFRYPPHLATATSMFVIFLSSILGTGMHAVLGEMNGWFILALAPGAWVGGKLGAYLASRISGKSLMWLLRATLLVVACKLIIEGLLEL